MDATYSYLSHLYLSKVQASVFTFSSSNCSLISWLLFFLLVQSKDASIYACKCIHAQLLQCGIDVMKVIGISTIR
uniref:Uncharacterized protein n=1 Tax=Arundo donax TaxID=35708 RepID=A0A0A9H1S5_ARUDO